jgi:hypothetical protein
VWPVDGIARWAGPRARVGAHLVLSPGEGTGLDEEGARERLEDDDLRLGGLRPAAADRDPRPSGPPGRGERHRDAEPRRRERAGPGGEGHVGLLHLPALEGPGQSLVRSRVDREQHDARGVAVEPLVNPDPGGLPAGSQVRLHVPHEAGASPVSRGVRGQARWLVHGEEGRVAEQDRARGQAEWPVRRLRSRAKEIGADERLDGLAHPQGPAGGPAHLPVDAHSAGRHQGAHPRPGHGSSDDAQEPPRERVRETEPGLAGLHPEPGPARAAFLLDHGPEASIPAPGRKRDAAVSH